MSVPDPIWITEADVVSVMHLGQAMDALEEGLRQERAGQALNMVKTHAVWDGGNTLHAIGAVFQGQGWFGAKSWGHTHGGATPLFMLWEAETGRLAAVVEAFALGQMRTGGISGVATRWMADQNADELAVIGSGKQALAQVAAVALVRTLKTVHVYSPTVANRAAFAAKLASFDFAVVEHDSVENVVRDVPIITTVTRARAPFLASDAVARGAHINAVGAITPERSEIAADLVSRCELAVVDDPAAASKLASEFASQFADQRGAGILRLCEIVDSPRRHSGSDLSIFKAMGMGISDLALATKIYARARASGVGRPFPHPDRATPRLRP